MYRIENPYLKVEVSSHGAELQSIYDKETEKEVLWQGDPKYWGRRSPILFPNVGRHSGDFYIWKEKKFYKAAWICKGYGIFLYRGKGE